VSEVRGSARLEHATLATTAMVAPALDEAPADGSLEGAVTSGDILETGDRGPAVRDLQRRLARLGHVIGVDGAFGDDTAAIVRRFQRAEHVAETGRVGPTTLLSLRVAEARRPDIAIGSLFPSVGAGRHLEAGASGVEVETLQRLLGLAGHPVDVDGDFGAGTAAALEAFQRSRGISVTGQLGPTTLQALDRAVDARAVDVASLLALPAGYDSLEQLAGRLVGLDGRYDPSTPRGRATLAMALAIGGTEVYGRGSTGTDFFTILGGTGDRMRGFAQFNLDFHDARTSTPARYAAFLADILQGRAAMPNSAAPSDHAAALTTRIADGRVQNGNDLRAFLDARGFGGSNWQGIDDGWSRVSGLADALVRFLRASAPAVVSTIG
jgi:peptidoglycan hydrolase-like protein with peptidoglycan-binding domain